MIYTRVFHLNPLLPAFVLNTYLHITYLLPIMLSNLPHFKIFHHKCKLVLTSLCTEATQELDHLSLSVCRLRFFLPSLLSSFDLRVLNWSFLNSILFSIFVGVFGWKFGKKHLDRIIKCLLKIIGRVDHNIYSDKNRVIKKKWLTT